MLVRGIVQHVYDDKTIDVTYDGGKELLKVATLSAYAIAGPILLEEVAVLIGNGAPLAIGSVYNDASEEGK